MQSLSNQQIISFQKKILSWYKEHKRNLPWRHLPFDTHKKERDPYKILLSEIMSQQTQIERVVPKYEVWLNRFPTIASLAEAPVSNVLQYWSGLGYNRRALNLQKTAQAIMRDHNGIFPRTEKELLALPGIGSYTARAIMCFAFEEQVIVIDTNVRKVILTQFIQPYCHDCTQTDPKGNTIHDANCDTSNKISDAQISDIAQQLLPKDRAYEWNQALMDYAGTMLKQHKIRIPKQSSFKGSRRYYRGRVLKLLLEKKEILLNEIGFLMKDDYSLADAPLKDSILLDLEKEGFIKVSKTVVRLKQ